MFRADRYKIAIFIGLIFSLGSCVKEDIGNMGTDVRLKPEYALPIGTPPINFSDYISVMNVLNPVDTALVPDTVNAFLYEDAFYEVPDQISFSFKAAFSLVGFEDKMQYFTSLMFRTNVANSIPAGINLQVYFLDASLGMLDSLYAPRLIVDAAEVNTAGNVTQPLIIPPIDSHLSQDKIQKISRVAFVEIKTQLTIPSKKQFYSKFYNEQDLRVQLGARIQLDIPLNGF